MGRSLEASPAGETIRVIERDAELIATTTLNSVMVAVAVFYVVEGGAPRYGTVLTLALATWGAGRLLSRRRGVGWSVADLAVVAAYLVSTPLLVSTTEFLSGASAMLAVAGTAVIAFGLAYPPRWSGPAAAVVIVAWSIGVVRTSGAGPPWAMFSLDFLVVEWVLVSICHHMVVRAATVTDAVLAGAAEQEVARTVAAARRRQALRQCALMHDTAASTLLMVGTGSVTRREVLAHQVDRDLAAIATFATQGGPQAEPIELMGKLASLCATVRTPVMMTGPDRLTIDRDIADAIVGAAGEALVNVDRHADATSVTVVVGRNVVEISDDGVGFDVESDRVAARFGVRRSILGRLENVGGHAAVRSNPGDGTAVTLSWSDLSGPAEMSQTVDGSALLERLLRGLGFGLVAIAVVVVLQSSQAIAGHDWWSIEIALAATALGCIAVAACALVKDVSPWWRWIAYVGLVGIVPIQVLLLPRAELTTGANWALWALGWAVTALVYRQPSRIASAALIGYWAVGSTVLLVASPTRETVAALGYNLASVALIQGLALVFTTYLSRAAQTAKNVTDAGVERIAQDTSERAIADDVRSQYAQLQRTLIPLLQRLRDPTTDPADPDVRMAALIEDARLRRLFAQADNRDHALLADMHPAIAAAEERGVTVTVDAGSALPDVDTAVRDRLMLGITLCLSGCRSHARIVCTADHGSGDSGSVTVSVVGDIDADTVEEVASTLGVVPATTETLTWLELTSPITPAVEGYSVEGRSVEGQRQ